MTNMTMSEIAEASKAAAAHASAYAAGRFSLALAFAEAASKAFEAAQEALAAEEEEEEEA